MDIGSAIAAIEAVDISEDKKLRESYALLKRELDGCGPNFFTKHFYFLGRALNEEQLRPLIFDDRVAGGLVKVALADRKLLTLVSISTKANMKAYFRYLDYASAQANLIGCRTDQIEYFLFQK